MSDVAIRIDGLGKQYRVGRRRAPDTLRDRLTHMASAPWRRAASLFRPATPGPSSGRPHKGDLFWALNDVSFAVKEGEAVGIIGRNGAGKSTLLKILSQITEPTTGEVQLFGRVASLLEVGTGFHPELTGRENVFLNGAILGMTRAEIGRKFDEIVAFAEVEKFIDTAVKHYSSGMYMRLAFAVAAHLEPEILVIDEVLAVGDAQFQNRCLGKMEQAAHNGRTVLFVSHNMGAIAQLCQRVLWISDGRLHQTGAPAPVINSYLRADTTTTSVWLRPETAGAGSDVTLRSVRLLSDTNRPVATPHYDEDFLVEVAYDVARPCSNLAVFLRVKDCQGHVLWTSWDTDTTGWESRLRPPGRYVSACTIPRQLLRPNRYLLSVGAYMPKNDRLVEYLDDALAFDVSPVGYQLNAGRVGLLTPLLSWRVTQPGDLRAVRSC
jgi:lipopolysaccharide transport system ATP-binding protein